MRGEPILEVSRVRANRGHGRHARQVLAETSFSVQAGQSLALVGISGAGKSTLAEVVLGLHAAANGQVSVQGKKWVDAKLRPDRRRRHLVQGVPQDPAAAFVPRWTIRTSIAQAIKRLADGTVSEKLMLHAAELAQFDPQLLNRHPAQLSGGQLQRAAITRALAVRPAVLVADEPTSALDPDTGEAVLTALLESTEQENIALLLVTHEPNFAQRCTRMLTLHPPTPDF